MKRLAVGALAATASVLLASSTASSHITLETSEAQSNAPYKMVLRVPHGCAGNATTAISVKIPEGIIGAKPMPKPGWALDIVKGPYAKEYAFHHGTKLSRGATTITWKNGSLPDDMYDEFVISAYVSDAFASGALVPVPVVQTCASGKSMSWIEVPKPGEDEHAIKAPAPILRIVEGHHDH